MVNRSAGVLLYRCRAGGLKVLLVHPGGPYWRGKDAGAWQIPKGMFEPGEDDETAARREASEELGVVIDATLEALGDIRQSGGKIVAGFATTMEFDTTGLVSNRIEIEWPPRSGRRVTIPEVNEARWFALEEARRCMLPSQLPLLDHLLDGLPRANRSVAAGS